jgi:hypothetical protein
VRSETPRIRSFAACATFTEAERVDAAEVDLAAGDWAGLGMDASPRVAATTTGQLSELRSWSRAAGAIGARLTGAGFGGCTINLVPAANAVAFVETMERAFYRGRPGAAEREHCFVVVPSAGASVTSAAAVSTSAVGVTARISSAAAVSFAASRASNETFAPFVARSLASASPIPLEPPVTIAWLPLTSVMR